MPVNINAIESIREAFRVMEEQENKKNVYNQEIAVKLLVDRGYSEKQSRLFVKNLDGCISHIATSKFFFGVCRWIGNREIDCTSRKDLSKIKRLLKVIEYTPAYDCLDSRFYSWIHRRFVSFDEVVQMLELDFNSYSKATDEIMGHKYQVVRIGSYEELLAYAEYAPTWCIMHSEEIYDSYLEGETDCVYLCLRDDYRTVRKTPGENFPMDAYGTSMIAVITDAENNFLCTTSRWNISREAEEFIKEDALKNLLGEEVFRKLYR